MKILIVEDEAVNRKLLMKYVENFGEVEAVGNGIEALEKFRAALNGDAAFDLVLLDIMMPEMDGKKALREIRDMEKKKGISEGEGAKIIMCTALHDYADVLESFKSMCDGYITKPVRKMDLMAQLQVLGMIPVEAGGDEEVMGEE